MPGLLTQHPALDSGAEGAAMHVGQQQGGVWQGIAASLSSNPDLVLPSSLYQNHQPTAQETQDYLEALAQRSPGAFLQRYGRLLTQPQLGSFEHLRSDYEVNHWLSHYTAPAQPSADQPGAVQGVPAAGGSNKTLVQNRRLAALQQLQKDGDYFSMSSMRERAPLLYHQLIGQYVGDAAPTDVDAAAQNGQTGAGTEAADNVAGSGTAGRLSESLMRQHEEAQLHLQMQEEQQQEDEQMSEQESSSDEMEGEQQASEGVAHSSQPNGPAVTAGAQEPVNLSTSELVQKRKEFQQEMEQRFLFGQDAGFDYQAVDQDLDGKLDEHWAAQVNRDAEDAYFEDIEDTGGTEDATEAGKEQQLGPGEYDY